MSKFLTELETINITDTLWKLTAPLVYESDLLKTKVIIPKGFLTDFASVPRIPVVYWFWGGRSHREAVLHDYLARKDSIPVVGYFRLHRVFLEAMKSRGKTFLVRWPMYIGVNVGGWLYFHKKKVADKS